MVLAPDILLKTDLPIPNARLLLHLTSEGQGGAPTASLVSGDEVHVARV